MANVNDFVGCVEQGVNVNSGVKSASYCGGRGTVTQTVGAMAEDNYYTSDSGSISQSIDQVKELKNQIDKTGILFKYYPEQKAKFDNVISEMQDYKSQKTSMQPSTLNKEIEQYDKSLYAAKFAWDTHELLNKADEYNADPYKIYEQYEKESTVGNTIKTYRKWIEFAKDIGAGLRPITASIPSGYSRIANTARYDHLDTAGITGRDGQSLKSGDLSTARNENHLIKVRLQYRGKETGRKDPPAPCGYGY